MTRPPAGATPAPDSGVPDEATLRTRLRELEAARFSMPPHAAQGLRGELDERIRSVRSQLARRADG